MIITNLIGGLGNQMFQYAVGRALSLHGGLPLRVDISNFNNYDLHQGFEISRIFNGTVEIASKTDMRRVLGWQSLPTIRRFVSKPGLAAIRRANLVVEPHFHFWPDIVKTPLECYLIGYWQSEKYFQNVDSLIREDFTFKIPMTKANANLAEQVAQLNAVSLHVRRGDYANNPKTTATHGLCSLEYYKAAIQYIAERVEQPVFFIFSDDVEWVKENLKIDFSCQYVDHNKGDESYNDMRLMSMCKHHIIANSSFSWWGAWLNPNIEKIVIAPKRWFVNTTDVSDLIPQGWVTL